MKNDHHSFPLNSNKVVDAAMVRARIERSKAFYSMFEDLFGRGDAGKNLSNG